MAPTFSETSLVITLPAWIDQVVHEFGPAADDDARMRLVVNLARHNVDRGGGPFAAAVFAGTQLVAAGVNLVLQTGLSIAHAEIVALMRFQHVVAQAPADGEAAAPTSLVTSTEPCCQCFGAIVWSGISRLVCGATTFDAERIGFDEGPKPDAWTDALEDRGISVVREICRTEAVAVLDQYARAGGTIYGRRSPRQPTP